MSLFSSFSKKGQAAERTRLWALNCLPSLTIKTTSHGWWSVSFGIKSSLCILSFLRLVKTGSELSEVCSSAAILLAHVIPKRSINVLHKWSMFRSRNFMMTHCKLLIHDNCARILLWKLAYVIKHSITNEAYMKTNIQVFAYPSDIQGNLAQIPSCLSLATVPLYPKANSGLYSSLLARWKKQWSKQDQQAWNR